MPGAVQAAGQAGGHLQERDPGLRLLHQGQGVLLRGLPEQVQGFLPERYDKKMKMLSIFLNEFIIVKVKEMTIVSSTPTIRNASENVPKFVKTVSLEVIYSDQPFTPLNLTS